MQIREEINFRRVSFVIMTQLCREADSVAFCFESFSKHAALKCGNFNKMGLFSFPPTITGNTYLRDRERVEGDRNTADCMFPSQLE